MTPGLYVGVISGTSVDGIDLALLEITPDRIRFERHDTVAIAPDLRAELLALGTPGANEIDRLGAADHRLGRAIGEAVTGFLLAAGVSADRVIAVGSHGQTVRHRPAGQAPFTLQLGDPNQIAEITGITCVADFRRRDMAAGGEGAPLVPPFHAALFRSGAETRVVLNLGGIANVTVLDKEPDAPVTGFDTGPANGLLDAWITRCRRQPFDRDGALAASGTVDAALLARLAGDAYFARPPPKSTGREHFSLDWLEARLPDDPLGDADVQATLAELTATSVVDAVARWAPGCGRLLVCGGGRHNGHLMSRLAALASCPLETTDSRGVSGDAVEAGAFAWLAARTLAGAAGNEPGVSGARGPRVLGAVYHK